MQSPRWIVGVAWAVALTGAVSFEACGAESCRVDGDCATGSRCCMGACVAEYSGCAECQSSDDCSSGEVCHLKHCVLGSQSNPGTPDAGPQTPDTGPTSQPFTLTSTDLNDGGTFPNPNTCHGADTQPALSWQNAPHGAQSFAVVLIDLTIDMVHWVAFDIPATVSSLAEGASNDHMMPSGAQEGSAFCSHYCGPCPPDVHTYEFRVYALSTSVIAFSPSGRFGDLELRQAFGPVMLDMAKLTGTAGP
jgi:Raf kinase inhibitor-like YbhB/YbcL family protein